MTLTASQGLWRDIKQDIRRYARPGVKWFYVWSELGLWAVLVYRFGHAMAHWRWPVVRWFGKAVAFFLFKMTEIITGVSLPPTARIGPGFYVGHFGGIIVHSQACLGAGCSIGPGVVIGTRGLGAEGVPVIEDNVFIGVGAKVLGRVRVGEGARIGANAVVLEDVPAGATAVGVPARIIGRPQQGQTPPLRGEHVDGATQQNTSDKRSVMNH